MAGKKSLSQHGGLCRATIFRDVIMKVGMKSGMMARSTVGFTLVEVAVAVCILLSALIPMSDLFAGSLATRQRAMALFQGQNIARDKMEEIISQGHLETGEGSLEIPAQPPYPAYQLAYQLQAAESAAAVMEIVVHISWGRATDENTFTLATFSPAD